MDSRWGYAGLFVIINLFLLAAPSVQATSFLDDENSLSDTSRTAIKIFRAKVLSSESMEQNTEIFTRLQLEVLESYKGAERTRSQETVMVPGGAVTKGKASRIAGVPHFESGDECIFFVNSKSFLVDWKKYEVSTNGSGSRFVVIQSEAPLVRRSAATGSLSHIEESTEVQTLDHFVTKVLEAQEPN